MTPKPRTVLVTGAHGFLGARVAKRLLADGQRVRGLVRRDATVPGVDLVLGDAADPDVVREAVAGADAVVHTVAYFGSDAAEARRVNVEGTALLADAALQEGCSRFVHLSTCGVYNLAGLELVEETTPLWDYDDTSPLIYGVSKAEGERAVMKAGAKGLPVVVLRPPNVVGADVLNAWSYHPPLAIKDRKFELAGDGSNTWPIVHVENLMEAILLALDHPKAVGQAYTLVDDHTTWGEYTSRIAGWFGAALGRREPTSPYGSFKGRFSSDKARAELGYLPRFTLDDAMQETQRFLQQQGIL